MITEKDCLSINRTYKVILLNRFATEIMDRQKVFTFCVVLSVVCWIFDQKCCAMTRQQMKNSGKLLKKTCMPKNDVTEEEVGEIEQGKFIETRNVMCYIACIYSMSQLVKNNKLSLEAVMKQVDMMFPPELKEPVKAAANHCKDVSKKYKDLCESSYWTAKCVYEYGPEIFVFP